MPTPLKVSIKTSLVRSAGYSAAALWAAIAVIQVYWALGVTWAITAVLVSVSALNFVDSSSWELLLGAFALFLALLCAIVAFLELPSARSDEAVGYSLFERNE